MPDVPEIEEFSAQTTPFRHAPRVPGSGTQGLREKARMVNLRAPHLLTLSEQKPSSLSPHAMQAKSSQTLVKVAPISESGVGEMCIKAQLG